MTPDPRLGRCCRPKRSEESPKKYRKNGSLENGDVRRTSCNDEIFVTLLTVSAATSEKSGRFEVAATTCGASWDAAATSGVAVLSVAERVRPVSTIPMTSPVTNSRKPKTRPRFIMLSPP